MSYLADYLAETARVIQAFDLAAVSDLVTALEQARRDGHRVFVCGNGGSASLASHLAADLNKGCLRPYLPPFRVIPLVDNLATLTAYGNDVDYAEVFAAQLPNHWQAGDLLLVISGSGNSENCVRALAWARAHEGRTAGLLAFGGGRCAPLCDVAVIAPTRDMQHAEDAHAVLCHLLMKVLSGEGTVD